MHPVAEAELHRLINFLPVAPEQDDLARFKLMASKLNQMILIEAIKSITGIRGIKFNPPRNYEKDVLKLYRVKCREIASITPYFFVFESAFRSYLANKIQAHHGSAIWWRSVEAALTSDPPCPDTAPGFTRQQDNCARQALLDIDEDKNRPGVLNIRRLAGVQHGSELFSMFELGTLGRLISAYWAVLKGDFDQRECGGDRLGENKFIDIFGKIRRARNEAYHHNPVREKEVIREEIIYLLSHIKIDAEAEVNHILSA